MAEISRTFAVRAPLPVVLDYLADWGNSREWDPGTISCVQIGDGPVEVGTEWRNVLRLLGRRVTVVFRREPAREGRFVFSGRNRGATSTDTITCAGLDDGRTSITYHSQVRFHRTAKLFGPLLVREFERIGDRLVPQLTTALEKRA
ncbi:SRPBCC family protein [Amycolatopsis sp. PS_44_ISF1]|uniref:SRPBCC family protein n=1 Tax=Amycolatopsis sp. PS_44_ISF1 TaxID=2974917 RepID=UPI0028DE9CF7|nr:SRPBCC family protein [Amycolatopsis sp. PS_44_ISF1]MDT8912441.1 SRPBCC family protein [Amycolatopsis sp. PS_44_ISF1]